MSAELIRDMNAKLGSNFKPQRATAFERQQRRLLRRAQQQRTPTGRTAERRKLKREEERYRLNVKRKVWKRSSFCELCADSEDQTAAKSPVREHDMHETTSRAQTRGLPKEERFNLTICLRACRPCHDKIHTKEIAVAFHDYRRGANGDYDVVDRDGNIVYAMRRGARPSGDLS